MAAYRMYFLSRTQFDYLRTLFGSAVDGQFIVLSTNGDYTDIAQYSAAYDTIKFVSVPTERLRRADELVIRTTK